jgi:hypothetical protein
MKQVKPFIGLMERLRVVPPTLELLRNALYGLDKLDGAKPLFDCLIVSQGFRVCSCKTPALPVN